MLLDRAKIVDVFDHLLLRRFLILIIQDLDHPWWSRCLWNWRHRHRRHRHRRRHSTLRVHLVILGV